MEEGALPEAVFISSNKGGDILLDPQQFQYRSQRTVKDHTYWICRKKDSRESHYCLKGRSYIHQGSKGTEMFDIYRNIYNQ